MIEDHLNISQFDDYNRCHQHSSCAVHVAFSPGVSDPAAEKIVVDRPKAPTIPVVSHSESTGWITDVLAALSNVICVDSGIPDVGKR
jgi:hypothetical protein